MRPFNRLGSVWLTSAATGLGLRPSDRPYPTGKRNSTSYVCSSVSKLRHPRPLCGKNIGPLIGRVRTGPLSQLGAVCTYGVPGVWLAGTVCTYSVPALWPVSVPRPPPVSPHHLLWASWFCPSRYRSAASLGTGIVWISKKIRRRRRQAPCLLPFSTRVFSVTTLHPTREGLFCPLDCGVL